MQMAAKDDYVLVPLDSNSSERIPVPNGETTLGRGPFLKITDKRVSRSHATLTNEGGRLLLCLKHPTNPCFYKAAGSTAYTQMQKDEEQFLSQGDCFSFLPNSLRFELQCVTAVMKEVEKGIAFASEAALEKDRDGKEEDAVDTSEQVKLSNPTVAKYSAPEADVDTHQADVDTHQADVDTHQVDADTHQKDVDTRLIDLTHQADVDIHQADVGTHQADVEIHQADVDTRQTDVSCLKGTDTSVTAERKGKSGNIPNGSSAVAVGCLGKKRKLPGWLSMGSVDGEREGSKEKKVKGKTPAVASKPPAKRRARISSDEDVKKSAPTKKRSQKKASSEAPHMCEDGGDKDDEEYSGQGPHTAKCPPANKSPPAKDKSSLPTDKSLPPCPYGQSCYRKNPAHFKEYCHLQGDSSKKDEDSDSSSDADSRLECPYGTACYRRNTLHQQQYKHTAAPAVNSPPRSSRTRRKRTVRTHKGRSNACDGDSDDDSLPNTYDYDDSFIDDDGMNSGTSSGDDNSDEDWQHPSDNGGGGEESEEDIKELAKEANEFVSNPKLHRR